MAKTSIVTPNGTKVEIDGTPEEIAAILASVNLGGGIAGTQPTPDQRSAQRTRRRRKSAVRPARPTEAGAGGAAADGAAGAADLAEIANKVRTCDEAENIEKKILDKSSQVNRVLLPLYIVYEYMDNRVGLTTGDIGRVTTQLSVPISSPNASTTLTGTAARYVVADTVRRPGVPVRYKLVRRGHQYLKSVITGQTSEDKE
jgi:hypothetical protein